MRITSVFFCVVVVVIAAVQVNGQGFNPGPFVGTACANDGFCPEGLTCISVTNSTKKECGYCTSNTQCDSSEFPLTVCELQQGAAAGSKPVCRRKGLFQDFLHWQDLLTMIVVLVLAAIASGGGIGGGGVFIPTYMIVAGFSANFAVPLSATTIAGVSIANIIQLAPKRHPTADRPLINYRLALLIQPMALCGTIFGVLLNLHFPNWLVLVFLIIVLSVASFRSYKKGRKLHQIEVELAKNPLVLGQDQETEMGEVNKHEGVSDELKKIYEAESKTPIGVVVAIAIVLAIITVSTLLKGKPGTPSMVGIEVCTPLYWTLTFVPIAVIVLLIAYLAYTMIHEHDVRIAQGYEYIEGDVVFHAKSSAGIAAFGMLAGTMAGLLGIGGGMLLNPMMLELHVLPEVTAATSAFMVFWTSLSSTIQYIILDRLFIDYALFYASLGFIASLIGQVGLNKLVVKYQKKSLIILSITFIITLSLVALVAIGINNLVLDIEGGRTAALSFRSLC